MQSELTTQEAIHILKQDIVALLTNDPDSELAQQLGRHLVDLYIAQAGE